MWHIRVTMPSHLQYFELACCVLFPEQSACARSSAGLFRSLSLCRFRFRAAASKVRRTLRIECSTNLGSRRRMGNLSLTAPILHTTLPLPLPSLSLNSTAAVRERRGSGEGERGEDGTRRASPSIASCDPRPRRGGRLRCTVGRGG